MPAQKLPLLLALSFSLLLVAASSESPIGTHCFEYKGNFSTSDPYIQALHNLGSYFLRSLEANPTGFTTETAGTGDFVIFGLALCRGDISTGTCTACVASAIDHLRRSCGGIRDAITWYDNCMVRYGAENFYGTMDENMRRYTGTKETTRKEEVDEYGITWKVVNVLTRVSSEAAGNEKTLFATEEADVVVDGKKKKLYTMAQCTRDITPRDCKSCLNIVIKDYPDYYPGAFGCRALSPNCIFRYELYPFY